MNYALGLERWSTITSFNLGHALLSMQASINLKLRSWKIDLWSTYEIEIVVVDIGI